MLNELLIGGSSAIVSGLVGFFISKKITSANFDIYVEKAKAQASAIENEAQLLLYKANIKSQEIELEAKKLYESAKDKAKADLLQREDELIKKEDYRVIIICVYKENSKVIISFQDNAGGILKENLSNVFDNHFTTKEHSDGTGIGLYMSKLIIDKISGRIQSLNEIIEHKGKKSEGAKFIITLPLI